MVGKAPEEVLVGLLQHEAEAVARQVALDALPDQAGGVVADGVGGLENTVRRLLADRMARVQHPIDRGHADAGLAGEIGYGGPACHGSSEADDILSSFLRCSD